MSSWTAKIIVPATTKHVPGQGRIETAPRHERTVTVEIDIQKVAERLGVKACVSKSRTSKALAGAVVVKAAWLVKAKK